eukprot:scaffold296659_cov19-Tisochrysis_lutea.AAC.1
MVRFSLTGLTMRTTIESPWQHTREGVSHGSPCACLRACRRMSDEQFWMVYFSLTAPLQPPEAFGRSPHPTSQQEQRQDAASPAGKHSREGDGVQGQGHSKASSRTGSSRDRQHEHEAASSSRAGQQGGKTGARGWDAWEDGDDDLEGWEEGPSGAG